MRTGMIISSIGVGTAIGISLVSMFMKDGDVIFLAGLGLITFFIGLGFILNGLFLTAPRREVSDRSSDANSQRSLDEIQAETNELALPNATKVFSSVTEHTTQHLTEKERVPRHK